MANLVDSYVLDENADRPNVILRVVDDEAWPFPTGGPRIGRATSVTYPVVEREPAQLSTLVGHDDELWDARPSALPGGAAGTSWARTDRTRTGGNLTQVPRWAARRPLCSAWTKAS